MTSSDYGRTGHAAIAYKHESPPAPKKRHKKAIAEQLESQALAEEQFANDEMERMWHRGYMMALKDVLLLFDDARVPKT